MLDLDGNKYIYSNSQLVEVICQLRFPTILKIEAHEPADFQDLIRKQFPKYSIQVENIPAQGTAQPTTVNNYNFISADNTYKISLTKNFIALSTIRYTDWDTFAGILDKPLGFFIKTYEPAYFERVGLRYVNAFSRSRLNEQTARWADLIQSRYLGILDDENIVETSVMKLAVDTEMKLEDNCFTRIHAGPGLVKTNIRTGNTIKTIQEQEPRFIFDQDVYSASHIEREQTIKVLDKLHNLADSQFANAITDRLHTALSPELSI